MDILSLLIFFIYTLAILVILIFISPLLSALAMILVPAASVYFLPDQTMQFFSIKQFSLSGISIYNVHILLLIWSALIGIVVYTEVLSWYLLRNEKPGPKEEVPELKEQKKPDAATLKFDEPPKSKRDKTEELLLKLGKLMSGKK